jgi:hypothetical protein
MLILVLISEAVAAKKRSTSHEHASFLFSTILLEQRSVAMFFLESKIKIILVCDSKRGKHFINNAEIQSANYPQLS